MLLVGLAGCLLPILPGPPLSWLGLVVLKFSSSFTEVLSWREVLLWGALVVIVTLGDFYKLKFCHSDIYMYICIVKQE